MLTAAGFRTHIWTTRPGPIVTFLCVLWPITDKYQLKRRICCGSQFRECSMYLDRELLGPWCWQKAERWEPTQLAFSLLLFYLVWKSGLWDSMTTFRVYLLLLVTPETSKVLH